MMTDLISRAEAIDALNNVLADYIPCLIGRNEEIPLKCAVAIRDLPPAQPMLYGYDLRSLIIFADAVKKKGITESEIEDFARDARVAWKYAWEEFVRMQKETHMCMRGDHNE